MPSLQFCLACQIIQGKIKPPGGVIYQDQYWLLTHSTQRILYPGWLILKPKRHLQHFFQLNEQELKRLPHILKETTRALKKTIPSAEKIYLGLFADQVKHLHFHLLPRTRELLKLGKGPKIMQALFEGKQRYDEEQIVKLVQRIKKALKKKYRTAEHSC